MSNELNGSISPIIDPEIAISIKNLTKSYRLYSSPLDRLKESLHPLRRQYHHDFYALNNVSFEIKKGDSVGIIGKNGSGKSTLLKILTGVLTPTRGTVSVNGKFSALLELGAGFNPEMTGIENVYFNGMLMGLTREQVNAKLDDILAFADIGEFVYQPVKIYSSGMFVRLAFAVAVNVEPEILIIDEALSVGDSAFQAKCTRKLEQFREKGATFLFVTHDLGAMKSLCDSAIYLKNGELYFAGTALDGADRYLNNLLIEANSGTHELTAIDNESKQIGSGTVVLNRCYVLCNNIEVSEVISDQEVVIVFEMKTLVSIDDPIVGFHIRNKNGLTVFETNTYCMRNKLASFVAGNMYRISFAVKLNIIRGDYSISFGCANKGYGRDMHQETFLFQHDVIFLKITENPESIIYGGIVNLMPKCSVVCSS